MGGRSINCVRFAVDMVISGLNGNEASIMLKELTKSVCEEYGIKINAK